MVVEIFSTSVMNANRVERQQFIDIFKKCCNFLSKLILQQTSIIGRQSETISSLTSDVRLLKEHIEYMCGSYPPLSVSRVTQLMMKQK